MSEEIIENTDKLSIGARLRKQRREMGDISEQTVNEKTHIRAEFIRFMEEDRFDMIPLAPVYRIGFLRIYAKFLQLDADALVNEYKKQSKLSGGNTRKPVAGVPFSVEISDGSEYSAPLEDSEEKSSVSIVKLAIWVVVAIVAAAIIVLGFSKISNLAENSVKVSTATIEAANAEYEISITTTASQKIKISENYEGWDREKSQPIVGKVIFDEQVLAGSRRTIKGHGRLYVQQDVPGATTITIGDGKGQSGKTAAFIVDPNK